MKNLLAFIAHLETIANSNEDSIAKIVANEALDRDHSEILNWFDDLIEHGCRSGMVSGLIYYIDTQAFFVKHYDEIIHLKDEYETAIGQPIMLDYQLANHLAWFSFEYVASKLHSHYNLVEVGD